MSSRWLGSHSTLLEGENRNIMKVLQKYAPITVMYVEIVLGPKHGNEQYEIIS
jgi:hypothetical protein